MKRESFEGSQEFEKSIITIVPPQETLSNVAEAQEAWPEVANDPEFREQVEFVESLTKSLHEVTSVLPRPDISLTEAVSRGLVRQEQVDQLYELLAQRLSNPDYQRIALYIPFEFFPKSGDQENFCTAYLSAWENLLTTHDVRANFVDGDVLEQHLRTREVHRVVKAAHLIPQMVQAGMIDISKVIELITITDDNVLKYSIAETIPVLADMKLITNFQIYEIEKMADPIVNDIIMAKPKKQNVPFEVMSNSSPNEIELVINEKIKEIDTAQFDTHTTTPSRANWLKMKQKQKTIELVGDTLAPMIIDGSLPNNKEWLQSILEQSGSGVKAAFAIGLQMGIKSLYDADFGKAKETYENVAPTIYELWKQDNAEVKQNLKQTLRHIAGLKIIDEIELSKYGIELVDLAAKPSEHLKSMEADLRQVRNLVESMEYVPQLAEHIFPVALVYGSRIKGYGDEHSDIDIAVIIKPGTAQSEQENIRQALKSHFVHPKIHSDIFQFWLEQDGEKLVVNDSMEAKDYVGRSSESYILFGSAWEGPENVVKELRGKLLTSYFYDQGTVIENKPARELHLEELERDNLQYRLMHKGYQKYNPPFGGQKTPHSHLLDGDSTFWDSGYRLVATQLYAQKVFLPKLKSQQ